MKEVFNMKGKKITYSQVGDNYDTKDPVKKMAQTAAAATANHLQKKNFKEISDSRGESAYVWSLGSTRDKKFLLASVIEGLGTKNLVADDIRKITGETYYEVIGHDTVATIINDLITVGATPLTIHAYWAIEDNSWLQDEKRMKDFIKGWKSACDISGVSWGGGETPTLKGIVLPGTVDLGGSAVGIINPSQRLITDKKLMSEDRILLLKSNGINANGLSLARAISKKLKKGYATKMDNGEMYGEEILRKTNIYANVLDRLFEHKIDIHYISNITGHGLRKIMRARRPFTYHIEEIFEPQELFLFIQKHSKLSDYEMYGTFNMGMDYALFLNKKDVKRAQKIIRRAGFESIEAGYVETGKKQVIIEPKDIIFSSETLNLR